MAIHYSYCTCYGCYRSSIDILLLSAHQGIVKWRAECMSCKHFRITTAGYATLFNVIMLMDLCHRSLNVKEDTRYQKCLIHTWIHTSALCK